MDRRDGLGYFFLTFGTMMATTALLDSLLAGFDGRMITTGAAIALACFAGLSLTWAPTARRATGEVA